jgi:hypothetical protein
MARRVRTWFESVLLTVSLLVGVEVRPVIAQERGSVTAPAPQQIPSQTNPASTPDRSVSLRKLPSNILQTRKTSFSFPRKP